MYKVQRTSKILQENQVQRTFYSQHENDYKIDDFLDQFYMSLKTNERSPQTISFYRQKLSCWLNWLNIKGIFSLAELKPQVIRQYLAEYKENHTIGGTHAYYRAIKTYLNWVWYEYDIELFNPINKVKCSNRQPDPIPGVNPDDINKLFRAAKQGLFPVRDCAILAILLDTGIRRSSLHAIQKQDIDTITGCLYIRHSKNKKPITVYLGYMAKKYIRKMMRALPADLPNDSTIWFNKDGSPMAINNFRSIIDRITKRAGVESYSLHDFRRFFALEAYRNGADIYAVSTLLNHSNIEVTKRYIAIDESDKREIHSRISPLDKKY